MDEAGKTLTVNHLGVGNHFNAVVYRGIRESQRELLEVADECMVCRMDLGIVAVEGMLM